MVIRLLSVFAILFGGMVFTPAVGQEPISIGIFDFPPFYSKRAGEPAKGMLVDLAKSDFSDAQIRYEFKIFHTPTLIQNIADGIVDVGMLIRHPKLIDTALYSQKPISSIELVAFRGMNSNKLNKVEDLAGQKVLVLAGYGYGGLINKIQKLRPQPKLIEASDIHSGLDMLLAGRGTYFLSYLKPSREIAQRKGYMGTDNWLVSDELSKFEVYWVVSKQSKNAKEILSKLEAVQR